MRIYEFMSTLKIARMEEPVHVNRRQKLNTFSLIKKTQLDKKKTNTEINNDDPLQCLRA